MSDQPAANNATTFKLAILAMLLSIWLIGHVSEPEPYEPPVKDDGYAIDVDLLMPTDDPMLTTGKDKGGTGDETPDDIDPATPGMVMGSVRFVGEMKPPAALVINADSLCAEFYRGKPMPVRETWVWGENDTVQNVLIHVTAGLPDQQWETPHETAVVAMEGCRFEPHVTTIMQGQLVEYHNRDRTLHNAHPVPRLGQGMQHSSPAGKVMPWMPTKAEVGVLVKGDVHAWMNSYVHVMAHPFFDLTGPRGTFEIKDLPPGEYEISLWHELKAFRESVMPMSVKIEPGKTTHIEFVIEPGW